MRWPEICAISIKTSRSWLKDERTSEIRIANCHIPVSNAMVGENLAQARPVLLPEQPYPRCS